MVFVFSGLAVIGIVLAGLYVFSLVWAERVERRYPPVGQRIKVDGRHIHYLEAGSGQPVVLLHGASSNLLDWKATVFDRLSKRYRVIAIDRPGYGWTEVSSPTDYKLQDQAVFLQSVFAALEIEDPIILAHSFGTAVGFAHLVAFPSQANGMVALSPVAKPWFGRFAWHRELSTVPVIGPLFTKTILVVGYLLKKEGAIACMFHPSDPPALYAERIGADLAYRPRSALQNAREVVHSAEGLAAISQDYSCIKVPITAIYDRTDQIVWADFHNAHVAALVPQTVFEELPGTGHFAHHLDPDAVIAAVDKMAQTQICEPAEKEGVLAR